MSHLEEYVGEALQKSRDEFTRAHRAPFLMLKLSTDENSEEWSFRTRTVFGLRSGGKTVRLSTEVERYRVFELVKLAGNPWPERVSVGRARNNDVVLADHSVSKLHLHFFLEDNGDMLMADAGSRNGTRINDETLAPGQRVAVHVGDTVVVGALLMTLVDAGGLYDLVHRQVMVKV